MNELIPCASGIIGSAAALRALAAKDAARLLILSDSHGAYDTFERLVTAYGAGCDALVFCGDGSGDVSRYIGNAAENVRLQEALPSVVFCVRGNGDAGQYALYHGDMLQVPQRLDFTVCGRKFLAVHGNRYSVDFGLDLISAAAESAGCAAAFFGHTHMPFFREINGIAYINPGSCARPRGGSEAGCAELVVSKETSGLVPEFLAV